ncbi:MAG: carbohydrate kinase [Clostridiales bacterium]|nr:carbohydrate kinase [Clostridiales bacterium]
MRYDVTAIGELLIDFACVSTDGGGYPTLAAHPGGAPGNLLAALSAYGCKTALLGKVGTDAFGGLLLDTLAQAGIETAGIVTDPDCFTTLAFVTLDSAGNRTFSFARKPGADTRLCYAELELRLIDDCRDFHFGTLSLTDDPARTATRKAVAYARERGKLISFDPNLRKPLWRDPDEAKRQMLWGASQADIVKISDEEVSFLWGCSPEEGAERLLRDCGADLVFVTLGPKGCYFSNGVASGTVETPTGIHPVDTTGAGDIFGGSVLSRILKTGGAPGRLTAEELREATRFACCAASLSTQRYGGISSVVPEGEVWDAVRRMDAD